MMRIMAIVTKPTTRRLISALAGSDIELVCTSGLFEALILLKRDKLDVVAVDCLAEGAEATCHYLSEVGSAHVVLVIGQKKQDWREMQSLDVDGYIPLEVNGAELVARLKAMLRHFRSTDELKNELGAGAPGEILTES